MERTVAPPVAKAGAASASMNNTINENTNGGALVLIDVRPRRFRRQCTGSHWRRRRGGERRHKPRWHHGHDTDGQHFRHVGRHGRLRWRREQQCGFHRRSGNRLHRAEGSVDRNGGGGLDGGQRRRWHGNRHSACRAWQNPQPRRRAPGAPPPPLPARLRGARLRRALATNAGYTGGTVSGSTASATVGHGGEVGYRHQFGDWRIRRRGHWGRWTWAAPAGLRDRDRFHGDSDSRCNDDSSALANATSGGGADRGQRRDRRVRREWRSRGRSARC